MIPRRASHLKNGVIRSLTRTPSIFCPAYSIPTRSGRRSVSFLEVTSSEAGFKRSDIGSKTSDQDSIVARLGGELDPDEDTMNASREAELLAMQHIFGLKDASEESLKVKPKDLERLQRLKAADPVFVCIDLEAYEFAQDKITEVGVSILDSRHVIGNDPGPDGMQWLSKITTRHMIIEEHKRLINKRFVHGCPDKFNFGKSEIVPLNRVHATLTHLFDNPSPGSVLATDRGPRKLILVGHGLSNDTAYLNKLKFAPHAKGNIIQDVDTQKFAGTKKQTVSLSRLMAGLGIDPENLHNAGNDAAYTLQALLLITLQHTKDPGAYIEAVAEAKGKVDPAKQRYKDHKAKIREQNQEKAKAARAARLQAGEPEKQTVESIFAEPLKEYEDGLASRDAIKLHNATEVQLPPEASSAAWETQQSSSSHKVPVSTVSELEGPVRYGGLTRHGRRQEMITSRLPDQYGPYKTIHLAIQPERVIQDLNSSSKKRKSPDAESTKGACNEDDDFSASPSLHSAPRPSQTRDRDDDEEGVSITDVQPHNDSMVQTTAEPLDTRQMTPGGSSLRITKQVLSPRKDPFYAYVDQLHTKEIMRGYFTETRTAVDPAKLTPDNHTVTHTVPDQPVVRWVTSETNSNLPRQVVKAQHEHRAGSHYQPSNLAATLQTSDQSLVRRIIVKDDGKWVDKSRERSQEPMIRKSNQVSRTDPQPKNIEVEEPPMKRSEKITGFLQKWLDDEK
jgi:hypothetical protein